MKELLFIIVLAALFAPWLWPVVFILTLYLLLTEDEN